MSKFQNKYRIESTRLKDWDYSNPWWYFITINTKRHFRYFGKIIDDKMILNELGMVVEKEWLNTKLIRKNVDLDSYVIMPDHIHGIIIINGSELADQSNKNNSTVETHRVRLKSNDISKIQIIAGDARGASVQDEKGDTFDASVRIVKNYLGDIVKGFKSTVTRQARSLGYIKFEWQPRYWDRIIRDEREVLNIRKYIEENPIKWAFEKEGYEG